MKEVRDRLYGAKKRYLALGEKNTLAQYGVAMFRSVVLLVAILLSTVVMSVPARTTRDTYAAVQTKDCTVYVTKTGHKYHRAGCQYLRSSAIKMSRSEAIKGGYTPCKKCGGSECE